MREASLHLTSEFDNFDRAVERILKKKTAAAKEYRFTATLLSNDAAALHCLRVSHIGPSGAKANQHIAWVAAGRRTGNGGGQVTFRFTTSERPALWWVRSDGASWQIDPHQHKRQ